MMSQNRVMLQITYSVILLIIFIKTLQKQLRGEAV